MTLFSKQADGRVQKGALYNLVKEKYHLQDDFEFIDSIASAIMNGESFTEEEITEEEVGE